MLMLVSTYAVTFEDIEDNLVGYWGFDGSYEESTNHISLTNAVNTPANTTDMNGLSDRALDFDGSSQYIEIDEVKLYFNSTDRTFCMWLNFDTASGNEYMLSANTHDGGFSDGMALWSDGTNIRGSHRIDNGSTQRNIFRSWSRTGEWNHYCLRLIQGGRMEIFINGTNYSRGNTDDQWSGYFSAFHMAQFHGGSGRYDGKIDNVALFNKSLNQSEIQFVFDNYDLLQPPIMTVEWNTSSPLDQSYQNDDPLTINYELFDVNGVATCDFYHNKSGSLVVNDTSNALTSGSQTFSYDPDPTEVNDIQMQVRCNDTATQDNTTLKTIHIDMVDVLTTLTSPPNTTTFNQTITASTINVTFSNTNLDYVEYRVFAPNGSLFQQNFTNPASSTFTFEDALVFPTVGKIGVWSLNTFGNDSASNDNIQNNTFTVLQNRIIVDWDSVAPSNGTNNTDASLVFNYEVLLTNAPSRCFFHEDGIEQDTNDHTVSGNFTFSQSYGTDIQEFRDYNINCTSGVFFNETSTKTILIDRDPTFAFGFVSVLPLIFMLFGLLIIIRIVRNSF